MHERFQGRVALITGGGGALGTCVARHLLEGGASVVLVDQDQARLRQAESQLDRHWGRLVLATGDVADVGAVRQVVRTAETTFARVDFLVNCAGRLATGAFAELSPEEWEAVLRVNVLGVVACCQAVIPVMARQGYGKIVNVSSVAGLRAGGAAGNMLYGASKAAVNALTQGLAREVGPLGIRVNAVAPGLFRSPLVADWLDRQDEAALRRRFPLGRLTTPEDVCEAIQYLLDSAADFVTGVILPVDGGFTVAM